MRHSEGTLEWFFEDRRFRAWRDDERCEMPPILWCQGEIGTGKTILVSQVLEHLLARHVPKGTLAVVYCRLDEQRSQSAGCILGLVLAQLFQNDNMGFDIPPVVVNAFKSRPSFWSRKPTSSQLEDWLSTRILEGGTPAYIQIDALDELQRLSRRRLLRVLDSLALRRHRFRLLVTSRHAPECVSDMFSGEPLNIHAQATDLRTFVDVQLLEDCTDRFRQLILGPARDPSFTSVKEEISVEIVRAARSMYACVCAILPCDPWGC